jgi:competence protein ComEC
MRQRSILSIALLFATAGFVAGPAGQAANPQGARATRPAAPAAAKPLDIYVVDTEGGKATLFVSPSGETVLIDTGNPGARDLDRIMEVISGAGVTKIDYLISTHYHVDHIGGMQEFVKRIPVGHFMDHGPSVEVREQVPGFQAAYAEIRSKAKHTVLKPGDRVPVAGLDWRIVASAGQALKTPLVGAGQANAALCADFQRRPDAASPDDNGQSVGSVITLGRFRVLDLGDLLWNNEFDLVCPRNQVGTVDLYMVTHHGLDQSGSPALVHSVRPRVAVMQNGPRKGGAPTTFQTLRRSPGLEDIWTLHWSYAGAIEHNSAGVFIANIDDMPTIAGILTAPPPAPRGGGPGGAPAAGAPPAAGATAPPPPGPGGAPPAAGAVPPPGAGAPPAPAVAGAPGAAPGQGAPGAPRAGGAGGGRGNQAAAHTPAYSIKISAQADGTFTVTNTRNGFSKTYVKR